MLHTKISWPAILILIPLYLFLLYPYQIYRSNTNENKDTRRKEKYLVPSLLLMWGLVEAREHQGLNPQAESKKITQQTKKNQSNSGQFKIFQSCQKQRTYT